MKSGEVCWDVALASVQEMAAGPGTCQWQREPRVVPG